MSERRYTPAIVVTPEIAQRLASGNLTQAEREEWREDFEMLLRWQGHIIITEDGHGQGNGVGVRKGAR